MADADRFPPCPECAAFPADPDPDLDHYEGFGRLRTPEELGPYPVEKSKLRHRTSAANVLAEYDMPQAVLCSIDNHPHRHGYVVRARCGSVLQLGSDCGRYLIEGFRGVERTAKRAREYAAFLPEMKERLTRLRPQYAKALGDQKRLWGFREFLGTEGRLLAQEMQNAYRVRNTVREAERIPGIELWNYEQPSIERIGPELRQFELNLRTWEEARPGYSEQVKLRERVRSMEERVEDFLGWARVAALLASREGMSTACRVLDSTWTETYVSAYDPRAGQMVSRREEIFQRTRERFVVTDAGVEVFGRLVAIAWT